MPRQSPAANRLGGEQPQRRKKGCAERGAAEEGGGGARTRGAAAASQTGGQLLRDTQPSVENRRAQPRDRNAPTTCRFARAAGAARLTLPRATSPAQGSNRQAVLSFSESEGQGAAAFPTPPPRRPALPAEAGSRQRHAANRRAGAASDAGLAQPLGASYGRQRRSARGTTCSRGD